MPSQRHNHPAPNAPAPPGTYEVLLPRDDAVDRAADVVERVRRLLDEEREEAGEDGEGGVALGRSEREGRERLERERAQRVGVCEPNSGGTAQAPSADLFRVRGEDAIRQ